MSNELLDLAVKAHGGLDRFLAVRSIDVTFNWYGNVLDVKGFPGHRRPTVSVDTTKPRAIIQGVENTGERWIFTPDRVWIEALDGSVVEERSDPKASFEGHIRTTKWDRMHLLYFLGYAVWNYVTTPFLFTWDGFESRELERHQENGEEWRVLEVTYPENIPAHTAVQKLYFDAKGILKRLDYAVDILGGVGAHYVYDEREFDGLIIPTLRRVVKRTENGPILSGPTSFVLDYTDVRINRF